MTETTTIPTADVSRPAQPVKISAEFREASAAAVDKRLSDIPWDKLIPVFQKPHWHGKLPLASYCERYDDIFECELIPARLWRPVSCKSDTTNGDKINVDNNILLHAVVIDLENGTSDEQIRERLRGFTALIHSTYRHSPNTPRWRVILPLHQAVGSSDWILMRDALLHRFDTLFDSEEFSKPLSWYRLPACPPDAKENYTMFQLEGKPLRMTSEFRLECVRSHNLKLQRESRMASHVVQNATSTPGLGDSPEIGGQPLVVTPAAKSPETSQIQATDMPSAASSTSPAKSANQTTKPETPCATKTAADTTNPTSHEDLMDELEALAQGYRKPDDYLRVRERYLEISLALNVHGLWAPAFRPEIPIPRKKSDRQPPHQLVQQDRVVIDCHWLHCNGSHVQSTEARWRPLFKCGKDFPFGLAEEFASREIPGEYRAEAILQLTHPQQVQLRALRGKAVQGLFESVKQSARVDGRRIPPRLEVVALAIKRWAEKDKRVASEREKYMAHAKAHELLKPASPTRREIAALAGLIRGAPALSERTVHDLLKKIDRELATSA